MADILRSVLFVDFDNVFFSLQSADKEAAKAFANDPQSWLDAIESGTLIEEGDGEGPIRRRILMRRCYANPAVMRYFRGWFTRSGFQIVDCPPLTGKGKNSADIYMVVDMIDAMRHETRFDEFIILSGDADFTPVLTRLRAYDRRSVIYSNAVTAPAYKALCDGMITEERLLDLTVGEDEEEAAERLGSLRAERRPDPALEGRAEAAEQGRADDAPGRPRADAAAQTDAPRPDNTRADAVIPLGAEGPAGAGEGESASAAEAGSRPVAFEPGQRPPGANGMRRADRRRMPREEAGGEGPAGRLPRMPEAMEPLVRRIAAATNVPAFAPDVYAALFRVLAAEVSSRGFSLNRTVNAVIRQLADAGLKLRPQAVAFVVKGLMLSGHEFLPTDTPGTLAKAFRRQALFLAANADLVLADAERSMVGAWIVGGLRAAGGPADPEPPSDTARAAEAAGAAIEETVHAIAPAAAPVDPAGTDTDGTDTDGTDTDGFEDGQTPYRGADEASDDDPAPGPRRDRNLDDLLARIRTPSGH
ncbi:NYN domain-containing protein [Prosthecomicrobium sp. N25]|uniref:NYN domain-containing protein n=1 Tax=Prosthecomicrobium sp. N25 TaxID=3129254 RepID=UPI003077029B